MGRVPQSPTFYERKRAQSKTHIQALRALARHLASVLFSMLKQNRNYRQPPEHSADFS
jgi:hypothetical protein